MYSSFNSLGIASFSFMAEWTGAHTEVQILLTTKTVV